MKLGIWSHWHGGLWNGEIPDAPEGTEAALEYVFRFFNRLDGADEERLRAIGYGLPSLSAGDIVTLGEDRWRCLATGWEQLPEHGGPRAVSLSEIAAHGGRLDARYYVEHAIGRPLGP
jgi:hypothetical protein